MKKSAGILIYRRSQRGLEVLLGHPGGPFFAKKDEGCWSIPKGEYEDEDPLLAAKREFEEELGCPVPATGEYLKLKEIIQPKSGKKVQVWAVEGDFAVEKAKSNTFELEWPPRSGKMQRFPEIDRVAWFTIEEGVKKVTLGQDEILRELQALL